MLQTMTDSEVQGMHRNYFDDGFLEKMESNSSQSLLRRLLRMKGSLVKVVNYVGSFLYLHYNRSNQVITISS